MFPHKNSQVSGDDSRNYQSENMHIHNGISFSEARQIAIDVFNSNFYKLAQEASEIATTRAERIVDNYLTRLEKESPKSLENVNNPDIQYALFNVQMEYARSGDDQLKDRLVELLIERTKEKDRTLKQIVLNEAITAVPRLTENQIKILSLAFLCKRVKFSEVDSHESLSRILEENITPYLLDISISENDILHLDYLGCVGLERFADSNPTEVYRKAYPGLFSKGFTIGEIQNFVIDPQLEVEFLAKINQLLVKCLNDSTLLQFNAMDENVLRKSSHNLGINENMTDQIVQLFRNSLLSNNEVEQLLKKYILILKKL